jgi:hypothetical protein
VIDMGDGQEGSTVPDSLFKKKERTITVIIPKITKSKEVYPKCIYANWKFCWQRANKIGSHTYWVAEYGKPDPKECAACLAAQINWGDGASRRPMTKEEVIKEKEALKIAVPSV